MIALAKPAPAERRLVFRGDNLAALKDHTSKEILLDGPAGTGKTSSVLAKLYCACTHPDYGGVRCLLLRKTRRSLTESGLVTFERDILGPTLGDFGAARREQRHAYHFPRNSSIVVGGLDDVGKIMSADYDLIAVLEATEAEEDEVEMLTTRLRNGRYPAQQLLMDCNPSYPQHWLNQRAKEGGRTRRYKSYHRDNPALFDWKTQTWTKRGQDYLAILAKLSGPRRARLEKGQWVQAEGTIYPEWNAEIHVRNLLPNGLTMPPAGWPVYLAIDFGYSPTHPFVCLFVVQDPEGRLWVYRELHESGKLVEDFAREIKELCRADGLVDERGNLTVRKIIADHDAEGRATLERYLQRSVTPAVKETLPSIQAVAARLRPDESGKPRLFVLSGALHRVDPRIAELKRPLCLVDEMDSWIWEDNEKKDVPVKDMDDSQDALRYLVYFLDRRYARGMRLDRL